MPATAWEKLETAFRPGFLTRDPDALKKYGTDWSGVLEPNAGAVVFPQSTDEVAKLLRLCHEARIAVVPSGGRTGLSGGAVAAHGELVLSLEKMNRIGTLDPQALTLELEAGVITQAVHEHCEPQGLTWPVDFASKGSSTVGGNIATNAGGVRVIRYGLTRNWVLGLTVVTMQGEVLRLNGALEKNNTGLDLRQMFIGSEGTLGVVTEATLKLVPVPREEHTRVCFFALENFRAVLALLESARQAPFTLSAFECLGVECMAEVVRHGMKNPFPGTPARAFALIEFEESQTGAGDAFLESVFALPGVLDGVMAQSAREKRELWALRERTPEYILGGGETHQQDLSVPIAHLADFAGEIAERYREKYPAYEAFIFGHIGDGNLHVFIRKPAGMASHEFHASCEAQDRDLFELTRKFGGSVSAEHGVGLLKKPALPYSREPLEIAYLRAMKRVFDPLELLNPGKIVDLAGEKVIS